MSNFLTHYASKFAKIAILKEILMIRVINQFLLQMYQEKLLEI